MAGDIMGHCRFCGESYYAVNGHSCAVLDRMPGMFGGYGNPWPSPGWVCPKCDRVYGPTVAECHTCNAAVSVTSAPAA